MLISEVAQVLDALAQFSVRGLYYVKGEYFMSKTDYSNRRPSNRQITYWTLCWFVENRVLLQDAGQHELFVF